MANAFDQLPNDVETLKRMLVGKNELIASLTAEVMRLRRVNYGRSAERIDPEIQPQLPLNGLPPAEPPATQPVEAITPDDSAQTQPPSDRRRRLRALPAHLPRRTIVHAPASCDCPDCGARMRPLGEDVSEMLNFVPGYFEVLRHVRPKLSCGVCSRIVQEAAPSRPIVRGLPTAAMMAQVMVSKYADHCPLYRQQAIYRRAGVDLERATMASWMGDGSKLLDPLVAALGRYVRSAEKLHADDTPVPVLEPGRGKTRTARLWTYVRDDRPSGSLDPPAVWYRYAPDRRGRHPQDHLAGYRGILQADGFAGYGELYKDGRIIEAACMAHARRKFYDLYVTDRSPLAQEAIRRIGQLYTIEREIRGQTPGVRGAVRQQRSLPILTELHTWLTGTLQTVSAKSPIAGAIKYSLVRWAALARFCADGRIEIDNNTAERSIRGVVLGKKNFLFMGADTGGERAANLYSLIATCQLNQIDPHAYLQYVLERIADHRINRIDELLPWNVAPLLGSTLRQAA
jgi:transposase